MCDAACRAKIIINGGFMGALAPVLADHQKFSDPVQKAAAKLGGAAKLHVAMLSAAGYHPAPSPETFAACPQAQALVAWITSGKVPADAVKQIEKMTADTWAAIILLTAGQWPT